MYCAEGDAIYNRLKGNTNLNNRIVLMYMAYGETPSHYNSWSWESVFHLQSLK